MAIRKPNQGALRNQTQRNHTRLPAGIRQGVEHASSPIAQRIMREYQAAAPGSKAIQSLAENADTPAALRKFLQSVIQS